MHQRSIHARWRPLTPALATLILLLTACGTPDRWHATPLPPAPDEDAAGELPPAAAPMPISTPAPLAAAIDPEGRLVLAVEDAVLLAMSGNRDLRVQRFGPTIAATFEQIERGIYDPEIFLRAQLERERASETDRGTGDRFDVDSEGTQATLGLRQTLPTGTTVELAGTQRRETSDRTPDQHESRVGLSVTQALLEGFGPAVNLAEIRQAAFDADISRYELRGFAEALVAETEIAYWRLVLAERRIATFERSLSVAERQRDDTATRIEVGAEARSAAAATHSEVARRRQALIETHSEREAQRLRLLRLVTPGGALDFDREVTTATEVAVEPTASNDLAARIALALDHRPELGEAQLRLEQRRLATVVTRNGLLPRLDFFVDLGKTGYGETVSDAIAAIDGDTWDLTLGIDFAYRLGDRAADARHLAAIASRAQARAAIANLAQLVELEVRLAWNELDRAQRQIEASAITRELQQETLAAERQRLEAGSSTQLLVAQAQRDLLAAEIAELEAMVAWRIGLIRLHLAEGTLLQRRGITVGD